MTGGCTCGTARFEIDAPFEDAGYCHCRRCQRRTGTAASLSAIVPASAFTLLQGAEAIRTWRPPDGLPKSFCGECGGQLYSGEPDGDGPVVVRFGALDEDPDIRPRWRQWMSSAAPWEPVPDDGLQRFDGSRAH